MVAGPLHFIFQKRAHALGGALMCCPFNNLQIAGHFRRPMTVILCAFRAENPEDSPTFRVKY